MSPNAQKYMDLYTTCSSEVSEEMDKIWYELSDEEVREVRSAIRALYDAEDKEYE